MAVLVRSS